MTKHTRLVFAQLVLIFSLFSQQTAFGQNLTDSDTQEIKLKALQTVELFQVFLNSISYELTNSTQRIKAIENSLSGNRKIFKDSQVRIMYDIDPDETSYERDVDVKTYLGDFDVFYQKSIDPTVIFSEYKVSDIYSSNEGSYYIKVQYLSEFNNGHKDKSTPYSPMRKIAELLVSKTISEWKPYIVNIRNYDPRDPMVYRELDFTPEYLNQQFNSAIAVAANYRSFYFYQEALDNYQKALTYKRLDSIEQRIFELKELLDEKNNRARFYNINEYGRELAQVDDNPDLYFERGLKYFDLNSYPPAITDFHNALRIAPNYYDAQLKLAEAYDANKQSDLAIDNYLKAFELYPENKQYFPRLTELLIDSDNSERAIPFLDELIASDPTNLAYRYQQAELYLKIKDYNQAISSYEYLLSKEPGNIELLLKLAEIEKLRGNVEKSREYLSQTGEISPSRSEEVISDLYEESKLALANGDTIKAELLLTQYLKLSPENAKGWIARAEIYKGFKEWENAILDYNEALQRFETGELYLDRGICYEKIGAVDNALDDYERALSLNASLCDVYRRRSLIYEYQNNPSGVARQLEAFLSCGKGTLPNYIELIEYYYEKEDYKKAIEIIDNAQKVFQNESALYCWESKIHVQNQEYIDAEFALKDAIKYNEKNAEAYYLMYLLYRDYINPKKADKYYNDAVRIDPSYQK